MEPAPDSPLGRRLAKHGEDVHHICFTTDDPGGGRDAGSASEGLTPAARSPATRTCPGSAGPGCCPTARTARWSRSRARTGPSTAGGRSTREGYVAVESVLVVGGGVMGNGIAQVVAQAGLDVTMVDVDEAALDSASRSASTAAWPASCVRSA